MLARLVRLVPIDILISSECQITVIQTGGENTKLFIVIQRFIQKRYAKSKVVPTFNTVKPRATSSIGPRTSLSSEKLWKVA